MNNWRGFVLIAMVILLNVPSQAQTGAGAVQGTVRDTSGAVLPGASVKLLHVATSVLTTTTTTGVGFFMFPSVPPGHYRITIESVGMQRWEGQFVVLTGQAAVVEPVLAVSGTTTEVTVAGDVSNPINVDNSTLGATLERQRIDQLPLNGRSITTLIGATTPGLEGTRAYGLAQAALDVVQDGAVLQNRDLGGVFVRPPGLDSVEEFRVESNGSSAKMNRPGTVILTTRSGTNKFHGSAFETARNNGIGVARQRQDYYDKPPHLVRNEFGFWSGGPVYLPKVYDGRNKTFWFFNYEAYRTYSATTASTTVPTAAMRGGDFSGLIDGTGRATAIYDPWTTDAKTWKRQPFAGNRIPVNRMSPLTKYLYGITPLPTHTDVNPIVRDNFFAPGPAIRRDHAETMKFDHNLSERDRVFLRYTHGNKYDKRMGNDASFPTLHDETNVTFTPARNDTGVVSWTHTISPTFFSETVGTYAYQRINVQSGTPGNWAEQLNLPNPMGGALFPMIINTGFYQYKQPDNERNNRTWIATIDQNFTKISGRHELQFGGRIRAERFFELPDGARSGTVSFSGPQTGLYDSASGATYGATPRTGHESANLFLGVAASYQAAFSHGMYHFRDREYAGYFQDNWRVNPRLTLNLGLRYEFQPPTSERDGLLTTFDLKTKSIVNGPSLEQMYAIGATRPSIIEAFTKIGTKFITAKQAGLPESLIHGDPWDFGPRAGFAYRLTSGAKTTVLRGGFSLFTYPPYVRTFYSRLRNDPPFQASFSTGINDAARSPDGLPNYGLRSVPQYVAGVNTRDAVNFDNPPNVARGGFTTYYLDPNQPSTRVAEWNLTVEREVASRIVARAAYVGNHGYNLEQWSAFNQAPNNYIWFSTTGKPLPTGAYASVARRNFDNTTYGDIHVYQRSGWSNFNGVQMELERRYAKGYGFQFFYVMGNAYRAGGDGWSDSLIQQPDVFMPGAVPTDPQKLNRFLNYQRDTDIPKHRVRWNWLVDLPFGHGRKIGQNASGLVDRLIGGWQFAGFGSVRSRYFALPTNNWGALGNMEIYGTKYKIEDCRSGQCYPGYLYYNGYIPANRINSYDAQGKPNGVMGVPENYKPAQQPIIPMPAGGPIAGDPMAAFYESNTVWVPMANGQTQRTGLDTNLHPWRNQYITAPNVFTLDGSLFKNTRINERFNLRFNADFFNVLNRAGLVLPNSSSGILSLQNSGQGARELQLGLRLSW